MPRRHRGRSGVRRRAHIRFPEYLRRADPRILPPRKPSPLSISLGLSLLKGERFNFVLQKGTELGADAFFPLPLALPLARCEAGLPPAKRESRERRWRRICLEAAKQRGRVPPPALHPVSPLDDFLSATKDFPLKLLLWLGEGRMRPKEAIEKGRTGPFPLRTAALFGPEGDLAPEGAGAARVAFSPPSPPWRAFSPPPPPPRNWHSRAMRAEFAHPGFPQKTHRRQVPRRADTRGFAKE